MLSHVAYITVCVRYLLPDKSKTNNSPTHGSDMYHCSPWQETLADWDRSSTAGLPDAAANYVRFVEDALGVPVLARRHRSQVGRPFRALP